MLLAVSQYNVQALVRFAPALKYLIIEHSLSKDIEHLFLYFLQFIFH